MEDNREEKIRKTVTFTHKQLGVTTGIAAALIAIAPIKEWFFTREEGVAQARELAALKHSVDTLRSEVSGKLERNTDKILERIREAEERTVKNEDRIERRVDSLEATFRFNKKPYTN